MISKLDQAIRNLLTTELKDLLAGNSPPVDLGVESTLYTVDPQSAESAPGEPRPADRLEQFLYDPQNPPASLTLSQPPYPGARRVRLTTRDGDRITLQPGEVTWDELNSQKFSVQPLPGRDLGRVNGVQVLYSVAAVFTSLKAELNFTIQLKSNQPDGLERAEALAVAVIEINRKALVDASSQEYQGGSYQAEVTVKDLKLRQVESPAADMRRLLYQVGIEIKATRALREDEGRPIARIRTPGRPVDADRAVDIHIEVDS